MNTTLTTAEICGIVALTGEAAPKRPNSKGVAIAALKRSIRAAIPNADADRAAAAILAAASGERAAAIFWKIEAEFNTATETAPNVAADAPIMPPRKSRMAALTIIEAAPAKQTAAKHAKPSNKSTGKRAAIIEAAQRGDLPPEPDFSAETHKRFRAKLAQIVAAAEAGDIEALKAFTINPVSSSPKAMAKYRDLAVIALEARAANGKAAA